MGCAHRAIGILVHTPFFFSRITALICLAELLRWLPLAEPAHFRPKNRRHITLAAAPLLRDAAFTIELMVNVPRSFYSPPTRPEVQLDTNLFF
jgi:hypothetical protein